ncbi:xanthine dehydrogenase family protein molybdopterin-binding subunit [Lentisalinibacter orientalis]|uniref:xanthine dehydrogenase family protein molybdopterin-binding subunit n=1 Tax=Lentisalinibacter orientalis TaxID=2992241 RepID=UPI00386E9440
MFGRFDRLPRPALDRRTFLKVVGLSGAGFMIGCGRGEEAAPGSATGSGAGTAGSAAGTAAATEEIATGPFILIGTDNTVTVIVKHLDKGQGVTTGLPTIVAEELDAAWSQMQAEFAPANVELYNNLAFGPMQGTGGSTSVANSWMQLRKAAAGAKAMLLGAAAARWDVPAGEITVKEGVLTHEPSGRSATFGELAVAAADITPPEDPALKDPADFTLIGTKVPRLDSAAKTDGSLEFTMDLTRPGMLVALVAHPPRFGAKVKSFDATEAKAVAGVTDVVEIPRGVAVVAESYWSALKGREALTVEWDESAAEKRGSEEFFAEYEAKAGGDGLVARNDGDAPAALSSAETVIRREYRLPFLAHATMEPMDCVVELVDGGCRIWTGSQIQTLDQNIAAGILGLQPEQVEINTIFAGGSFGRRAVPDSDYVADAVSVAKAIGGRAPVKLIWTREDDMRAGRYRPMSYHVLEGALDADGKPAAWRHQAVIQSFMRGTLFDGMIQDGLDPSAVEGSRDLPYTIPNLRVDWHPFDNGVPTLWWRSVGHTQNAFVTEVFIDELAAAAGRDPVELRRELLTEHPRHLGVLELAAEKAGWGEDLGPNRGRGVAVHKSFGTYVAEVADVTVRDDGSFSVDRVVCAVDCGIAINPDVIRAQMEGGIAYALSAALREEITLEDGKVQQDNFDNYRPLRIDEMPQVEVHIVQSGEAPTGVGEPGVPPLAPAVANAVFAATGERTYRLPFVRS